MGERSDWTDQISTPNRWSQEDVHWLKMAINEEVMRQLLELDPITLCRLTLVMLERQQQQLVRWQSR
jgi:hypothetical protein